jgi:hypothetical protein
LFRRLVDHPSHKFYMAQAMDVLSYKRDVLTQLLLVATILGAFAMSGVVAILVGPNRDRLHRFLFCALCLASLAFIFATALDAVLLPATGRKANLLLPPERIQTLSGLCDGVVWAVIIGALALVTAIGGFGFAFSRRLGCLVGVVAVAVVIILFLYFRSLATALS